jgi:hypothetical protein
MDEACVKRESSRMKGVGQVNSAIHGGFHERWRRRNVKPEPNYRKQNKEILIIDWYLPYGIW